MEAGQKTNPYAVSVRSLAKFYSEGIFTRTEVVALKSISLDVREGHIFALIGPNGAGKSTLMKILMGIVHPSQGEAFIFGRSISGPLARGSVGFLPEKFHYPSSVTWKQFIRLGGRLAGLKER